MSSVAARRRHVATVAALLTAALIVSLVVARVSSAGFSASTGSTGAWSTGTVALTNDRVGSAMFSTGVDGLLDGGSSKAQCIAVTYSGTLTQDLAIHLYGTAAGALAPNVQLKVEEGTGGTGASCAGFTNTTDLYAGTLADFAATRSTFATGLSAWAPTSPPQTRTYRFTTTINNVAAAQSKSATATFTWEAASFVYDAPFTTHGDDLTDAAPLTMPAPGGTSSLYFTMAGTTFEQREIDDYLLYGDEAGGSRWFSFTPTHSGRFLFDFLTSGLPNPMCEPEVNVYRGTTYDNRTYVDREGSANVSAVPGGYTDRACPYQWADYADLVAGENHLIRVEAYSYDKFAGRIRVREMTGPSNDDIANATILPLTAGTGTFTQRMNTWAATPQAGETGKSIWFKYTPTSGQVLTALPISPAGVLVAVFAAPTGTATTMADLALLTADATGSTNTYLNAGTTYYLRITDPSASPSTARVDFSAVTIANYATTAVAAPAIIAAQRTTSGRAIRDIAVSGGLFYLGYGDYSANTGPIDVVSVDPTNGATSGSLLSVPTEQISVLRTIGGKLYAPMTDPNLAWTANVGYATNASGSWTNQFKAPAIHVFDVATLTGTDLWMVGSNLKAGPSDGQAVAYRSTDSGATWTAVATDSNAITDDTEYERYYWAAAIGGKMYLQARGVTPTPPLRIFNGTTWTTSTAFPGLCDMPEPNQVEVFKGAIICTNGEGLTRFTGAAATTATVGAGVVHDLAVPGDGYIYALGHNTIVRSFDGTNWTSLAATPTGARSIAVYNQQVYVGTADGQVLRLQGLVAGP